MLDDLRAAVLEANLAIVRAGLVVLTFGNVSGIDRDAGVVAIKPSGIPYDELTPSTIVLVELASGVAIDTERRASSDIETHLALYRAFPTVSGVVHTHSPFATAWAQAGRDLPCYGTTHADHFRGAVPVTRPLTSDEIDTDYERNTGLAIVETFHQRHLDPWEVPAALVVAHGPFVWGPSLDEAVENAVALETVAAAAVWTEQITPGGHPMPDRLRDRHFLRKHGPGAYYGQAR
jgi:L-ribulose-5-phosphate 4-epimerase